MLVLLFGRFKKIRSKKLLLAETDETIEFNPRFHFMSFFRNGEL